MKNNSIWQEYLENNYAKLDEDLDVDILIIGAGLTGLATAHFLLGKNLKVAVLEKNVVGSGITSKSTAKVSFLQENMYSKIKKYRNYHDSYMYYKAQKEGLKIIKNIIEKYHIDCDFEQSDSYLYTFKNKQKELDNEKHLLQIYDVHTEQKKALPNDLKVNDSFFVTDVYTFNPVKYLNALASNISKEIPIYENSCVTELIKTKEGYLALCNNKRVKAKYVVLACHYPFFLFPFFFPLKSLLQKSYIVARKAKNDNFNAINLDKPVLSIRYYQDYEINLSEPHNIAYKNDEEKNFQKLNYKDYEYAWSNIDIYTKDYLPYIGKINKHLLIGTGYATWGMINSQIAGKVLSDIILNRYNEYKTLFNPKRFSFKSIIRYPLIIYANAYSFLKNKVYRKKKYLKNVIYYVKTKEGKKAIYVDEEGHKHSVMLNCPHMKCSLIFNSVEKTWDCPCHGSRFDLDGKLLDSPSVKHITK